MVLSRFVLQHSIDVSESESAQTRLARLGSCMKWWSSGLLYRRVQLTLEHLIDICVQLASGVQHLHMACSILHRDLKSDNALGVSLAPQIVKWADFGCSVQLTGRSEPGGSGKKYDLGVSTQT